MLKRFSLLFLGVALSLVIPAAAQTNPSMNSPEDVDRTEMEIQTTTPTLTNNQVAVDPSEVIQARPFSLEANYMSIPGVYRYLTYERTGTWLSRHEAVAQVKTEIESATR